MKLFDAVGKDHEEFKLRLNKDKDVELAQIRVQADIASSQATVARRSAQDTRRSTSSAAKGSSSTASPARSPPAKPSTGSSKTATRSTDVKETFFNGDPEYFHTQVAGYIDRFGLTSEDVKNLSVGRRADADG